MTTAQAEALRLSPDSPTLDKGPAWFASVLAVAPERGTCEVSGTSIETLAWGERGKPGLLFLHGNGGHADWWRFIAPFFASDWRVGAISWSGMGRSGWRKSYPPEVHLAELLAGAEATGLFEGTVRPSIVAHSFGSAIALKVAASPDGARFGRLIVADNGARPPREDPFDNRKPWTNPGYTSLDEGAARFRLRPEQRCDNDYLLAFIARRSLVLRDGRWHWCFDPDADRSRGVPFSGHSGDVIAAAQCPLDFLWGDRSSLVPDEVMAATRAVAPPGTRFVTIPDAGHHLMLDQPLAFVTAVRALLGAGG